MIERIHYINNYCNSNILLSYQQKLSTLRANTAETKKSLFAQQFATSGSGLFGVPEEQMKNLLTSRDKSKKSGVETASNVTAQFSKPSLISGEGLTGSANERVHLDKAIDEIHSENVAKLEAMTKDEILEEQARIKASLGKKVVDTTVYARNKFY